MSTQALMSKCYNSSHSPLVDLNFALGLLKTEEGLKEAAESYFKKAAKEGCHKAQYRYALLLDEKNDKRALELFQQAAAGGCPEAKQHLEKSAKKA